MIQIEQRNFAFMYWDLLPECDMDFNLLAFITYIIDVYNILDTKEFDGKEYKRLSNSFIQNKIDWSDSTIDRYIAKAEELGLISRITDRATVFKKNSKARYIKLNVSIVGSDMGSDIGSHIGSYVGSKRTIKQTNNLTNQQTNNVEGEGTSPDPSHFKEDEQIVKQSENKYTGARRPRLGSDYGHAKFTDEEWKQLQQEFPTDYIARVRRIDTWCEQSGKEYNNYLVAVREWDKRDKERSKQIQSTKKVDDSRTELDMSGYEAL